MTFLSSPRRTIGLLALISLFTVGLYALLVPPFEVSDEVWHYPFVDRLARGEGLPIQQGGLTDSEAPWRQEGSQPPLYYFLASLPLRLLPQSDLSASRTLNPHSDMGHPRADGNINIVVRVPGQPVPWGLYIARVLSVIFSVGTVIATYGVATALIPPDTRNAPFLRFASALTVAVIPMFAFIGGSVNNDNAAVFFSTVGLWWALRLLRQGTLSISEAVAAGLLVGCGALSKSSVLGLLPLFALSAGLALVSGRRSGPHNLKLKAICYLRFMGIIAVIAALISGWWFLRNQMLYGDPLGWNAFLEVVGQRGVRPSWTQLWSERESFVYSFWGFFGAMNLLLPGWVYHTFYVLFVISLVGAFRGLLSLVRRGDLSLDRGKAWLVTALWIAIIMVGLYRWTSLTLASQGRLIFPTIAGLATCFVAGLYQWHRGVVIAALLWLATVTLLSPILVIRPAYSAPPSLVAVQPEVTIDVDFGEALTLLGADLPNGPVTPGEDTTLTLYWEVVQPLPDRYSVFVHLVDERGVIIAQRDMYPGQGSLTTDTLATDYRWQDRYTLIIPEIVTGSTSLQWAIGLYDHATNQRLPITGSASGDTVTLPGPPLMARPPNSPPLVTYTEGLALRDVALLTPYLSPSEPLSVEMTWVAEQPISKRYVLSLQLFHEEGERYGQWDGDFGEGSLPTPAWPVGEGVSGRVEVPVADDLPPGQYRLLLVWYRADDLQRLIPYRANGQVIGSEVEIARFRYSTP